MLSARRAVVLYRELWTADPLHAGRPLGRMHFKTDAQNAFPGALDS